MSTNGLKYDDDFMGEDEVESSTSAWILASLFSGFCRDGENLENDVSFRIFGTNRNINVFGLRIHPLKDKDKKEECHIAASASYETETNFRNDKTPDWIEINLFTSIDRFNDLKELIESDRILTHLIV